MYNVTFNSPYNGMRLLPWLAAAYVLAAGLPLGASLSTANRPSIVVIGDGLTESSFRPESSGFGSWLVSNYTRRVRTGHTAGR